MSTIQYSSLEAMMCNFSGIKEDLYEELRSSDISWGSEKQKTIVDADYIYDIIDEHLTQALDAAEDDAAVRLYDGYLEKLARIKGTRVLYYCMEE